MGDPQFCEGYYREIERILRAVDHEPLVVEHVMSFDSMMARVAAGLAIGLMGASQIAACRKPGIVTRPLAGRPLLLTTYLLRQDADPLGTLSRFIARVAALEVDADKVRSTTGPDPDELADSP